MNAGGKYDVASTIWRTVRCGNGGEFPEGIISTTILTGWYELIDSARHVIGSCLTQETRVQYAFDDVASTIHQTLPAGCPPCCAPGRAWQASPATSSKRVLIPRLFTTDR